MRCYMLLCAVMRLYALYAPVCAYMRLYAPICACMRLHWPGTRKNAYEPYDLGFKILKGEQTTNPSPSNRP